MLKFSPDSPFMAREYSFNSSDREDSCQKLFLAGLLRRLSFLAILPKDSLDKVSGVILSLGIIIRIVFLIIPSFIPSKYPAFYPSGEAVMISSLPTVEYVLL